MSKFNRGDQVRVIVKNCRYYNVEAAISDVREGRAHPYRISGMDPWWFSEAEIVEAGK